MKKCTVCKENKPLNAYYRSYKTKDKLKPHCIACQKSSKLKKAYGITLKDRNNILENQNNCCAICNTKIKGQINVDHCHNTGKLREILCSPCNFLLGNCKDNPEILRNAIQYLEKHHGN